MVLHVSPIYHKTQICSLALFLSAYATSSTLKAVAASREALCPAVEDSVVYAIVTTTVSTNSFVEFSKIIEKNRAYVT
jgi:hypothetical protein